MNVFLTKIRLRDDTTVQKVFNLIKEWLTKSPHYNEEIKDIAYEYEKYLEMPFGKKYSATVLNTEINSDKLFAFRFKNKSEKENIWTTDCIYVEEETKKYISVHLSCARNDFENQLPVIHTPYIVKLFIKSGLCYEKGVFRIQDKPVLLKDGEHDLDICSEIMLGKREIDFPVVYISYNNKICDWPVDVEKLAKELAGVAYVLREPKGIVFSKKLADKTNRKNIFNGYIGIYYSDSTRKKISCRDLYSESNKDKEQLAKEVAQTVKQSIINYNDPNAYDWNSIHAAYHREMFSAAEENLKKLSEEKEHLSEKTEELGEVIANLREQHRKYEDSSENEKQELKDENQKLKTEIRRKEKELDDYHEKFDVENEELKAENERLKNKLEVKERIIQNRKEKEDLKNSLVFKTDGITEFYDDELHDLVISVLSHAKEKSNASTRINELLSIFLETNPVAGIGKKIFEDIDDIVKEPNLKKRKNLMSEAGFAIVSESPHTVVLFHNDKNYRFTFPNTPSDKRSGKNIESEIHSKLDIYKKFF